MVLVPVLVMAADLLRMVAESNGSATGGFDPKAGTAAMEATMASIAAHAGIYGVATVITFVAALVGVPAVVLGWRLSVGATPVMAWVAAGVGVLFVIGRVTHTFTAFALPLFLAQTMTPADGAAFYAGVNQPWSTTLVIIPAVLGIALWFPLLAAALYRARVIPLWAMMSMLAGTVVLMVMGSSFIATPVFAALTVAGLLPMLRQVVGNRE